MLGSPTLVTRGRPPTASEADTFATPVLSEALELEAQFSVASREMRAPRALSADCSRLVATPGASKARRVASRPCSGWLVRNAQARSVPIVLRHKKNLAGGFVELQHAGELERDMTGHQCTTPSPPARTTSARHRNATTNLRRSTADAGFPRRDQVSIWNLQKLVDIRFYRA